jgi:hypothetical protein
MITATIDKKRQAGLRLDKYPSAPFIDDDGPLPYPEEDLISHEEFMEYFEKRLYERLGLKIKL